MKYLFPYAIKNLKKDIYLLIHQKLDKVDLK